MNHHVEKIVADLRFCWMYMTQPSFRMWVDLKDNQEIVDRMYHEMRQKTILEVSQMYQIDPEKLEERLKHYS